jgi:AhpD family alkylhydroperoxidase
MNKQPRLNYPKVAPHVFQAMLGVEKAVLTSGLEKPLLELIKLRVSQINGCAFCIDMHSRDAKKAGETDQRLHLLNAWHEVDGIYTPRESAALRWTEALTRLSSGHVTDKDFAAVSAEFSEVEVANLTLAIVAINGWNRFGVGFKMPVGFLG